MDDRLVALAEVERTTVFARQLAERLKVEISAERHSVNVTEDHQREFDALWQASERRHYWCKAKTLLTGLNRELREAGHGQISARLLSRRMRGEEVPQEMARLIERAEELSGSVS